MNASESLPSSPTRRNIMIGVGVCVLGLVIGLIVYFSTKSSGPGKIPVTPGTATTPSPSPPPPPPLSPPCDASSLKCTSNDSYSVCHPDGYPTCVICSDFNNFVKDDTCGSSSYPKCNTNGRTICITCSDYSSTKCPAVNTYAQCGPDGKTACVQCSDYESVSETCQPNEFAKCIHGTTQCVPCQDTTKVTCSFDKYAKCSSDGTTVTCVSCDDYAGKTCPDNQYPQCIGTNSGSSTVCQLCSDFNTKSPSCVAGTYAECKVSADKMSYATTCISDCAGSSSLQGCTGPNYEQVCNYSAQPPHYECKYIGPCQSPAPTCDSQETLDCNSSTKQWSCQPKPGTVEAIMQRYGLVSKQVFDTTGTCSGGMCTVYCQDAACDVPVVPTVGPYNMGNGTRCNWYTPMETKGVFDLASVKTLNNPPFNLIRQDDGSLKLVNLATDTDYVSYVNSAASPSVPYTNNCYVVNTCDPSSRAGSTVDANHNLLCNCAAGHFGPDCTFTIASCNNVSGSVPTVATTCENCGYAQEGQHSLCICKVGGWGILGETLGSCSCPVGYAGPTCNFTRGSTCSTHGNPQNDGSCQCDVGFAGPNCATGRSYCSNHGNPTYTGGTIQCPKCDSKDFNGPLCQYSRENTCNGVGVPDINGICQCDDPRSNAGNNCQYTRAETCNNLGTPESDGSCICDDPNQSAGQNCQYSRDLTCNGGGKPQNDGTCVCDDANYNGVTCEFSRTVTCNNVGLPQPDGTCHCDTNFYNGQHCEYSWDKTCGKAGIPDVSGNCTCFEYGDVAPNSFSFYNLGNDKKCTSVAGTITWVGSGNWLLGSSGNSSGGGNATCTKTPTGWIYNRSTGQILLADGTLTPQYCLAFTQPVQNGTAVVIEKIGTSAWESWSWDWSHNGPITPMGNSNFALNVVNHTFTEGNTVILWQDSNNYPMSFSTIPSPKNVYPQEVLAEPCPIHQYASSPSVDPCVPYSP